MTRYTILLFQHAYPDQIEILKINSKEGINIECWLLKEDKTPHMKLFDGGPFKNEEQIKETMRKILEIKIV